MPHCSGATRVIALVVASCLASCTLSMDKASQCGDGDKSGGSDSKSSGASKMPGENANQADGAPMGSNDGGGPGGDPSKPPSSSSTLPDISTFVSNRSDRFLVDPSVIDTGHPYLGARANIPHTGAHLQLENRTNKWPKGGTSPSNYPAIYAVADGVIARVDTYYPVGANYRYGFDLTFARRSGSDVNFGYSVEPMIDPGDPGFYKPYISATAGQTVKKGDILGYFYIPPNNDGSAHIHFNLQTVQGGQPMAPSIFTSTLLDEFFAHWGGPRTDGTFGAGPAIGRCMGYKLSAAENPFGTGAVDSQD